MIKGKSPKGQIGIPVILIVVVAVIILLALVPIISAMISGMSLDRALSIIDQNGYVAFAAGEYDDIVEQLEDIELKVDELESHTHSMERWMGISGDQSGNDWCSIDSLTPYRAISGNGAFGSDASDEAKVIGTDDTPHIAGMTTFDIHHIMVTAASVATDYYLRIVWGTGTMADALTAGQYSHTMVQEAKKGTPIEVHMSELDVEINKVWIQAKNATDNSTIDFFVGAHEY